MLDSVDITNHGTNYSATPSLIASSPLCSCNGASGAIPGPMDDCLTAQVALGALLIARRASGAVFIGNVASGARIRAKVAEGASLKPNTAAGASVVRIQFIIAYSDMNTRYIKSIAAFICTFAFFIF